MMAAEARNDREVVLARVREALRVETSGHVKPEGLRDAPAAPEDYSGCLPSVPQDRDGMLDAFAQRSVGLKTEFETFASKAGLAERLRALASENAWQSVGWHRHALVTPLVEALGLASVCTSEPYQAESLEQCDVAITACDALIAQTGSVLVTSASTGGRALTVLPPHHVVVARVEQMVADLPSAYALVQQRYAQNWPSMISVITGPSRTGDIERILVLGAHGPKRLSVLLLMDDG